MSEQPQPATKSSNKPGMLRRVVGGAISGAKSILHAIKRNKRRRGRP